VAELGIKPGISTSLVTDVLTTELPNGRLILITFLAYTSVTFKIVHQLGSHSVKSRQTYINFDNIKLK
jgi:hypothetical protein